MTSGWTTSGLTLVKKAPQKAVMDVAETVLREGSTGRVVTMVPRLWAVAEVAAKEVPADAPAAVVPGSRPVAEMAFYRKYTQALLRRYVRMSTHAGRVPSLLGREMFRGNVSSYRVTTFEDVVVFCMDVEKCLARLDAQEKEVIKRVALQEYTQAEAAGVMGLSLRNVVVQYGQALDRLTRMLLDRRLLEPLKSCQ